MLHLHLQHNSWLNVACELIFNRAELLQSSDLSGRQALNSRNFAGASGCTQELLYQDVTAEIPAQSAPRGATEHGSAERGAPGWALLWDDECKPAGLPRTATNALCNQATTSHWKGLFWEQGMMWSWQVTFGSSPCSTGCWQRAGPSSAAEREVTITPVVLSKLVS